MPVFKEPGQHFVSYPGPASQPTVKPTPTPLAYIPPGVAPILNATGGPTKPQNRPQAPPVAPAIQTNWYLEMLRSAAGRTTQLGINAPGPGGQIDYSNYPQGFVSSPKPEFPAPAAQVPYQITRQNLSLNPMVPSTGVVEGQIQRNAQTLPTSTGMVEGAIQNQANRRVEGWGPVAINAIREQQATQARMKAYAQEKAANDAFLRGWQNYLNQLLKTQQPVTGGAGGGGYPWYSYGGWGGGGGGGYGRYGRTAPKWFIDLVKFTI